MSTLRNYWVVTQEDETMFFPRFDGYDMLTTPQKDLLHAVSDLLVKLNLSLLNKEETFARICVEKSYY